MALTDPTIRPRAIRLVEYLEAVRGLREQPIRDLAEYRDKRWWAADIPAHPACVVTAAGEEPWLRVSKASVPLPPPVPAAVTPYLLQAGEVDPECEPSLIDNISEIFDGEDEELADLRGQLEAYVTGPWQEWAVQARPAVQARALYDDLFELRQRLQRDSSMIELVWGNGILSWMAGDVRIVHPLVTTQVQLSFDVQTGAISVVPEALLEQQHHLEIDMLQGLRLSGFDLLVDARERYRVDATGPFDPENGLLYEKLLAPLGHDGQVVVAATPPPPTSEPTITATWVLMVRRRATMYRRFFGDLHNALDSGQLEVPAPLAAVVADDPSKLELENLPDGDDTWHRSAERLLMPLPSNPEQEQVATRLAQHRGVTVQGPPGTGKTHTIANLICHLIGQGKRVLVTSQKEQALGVLREKIPESVRDLSVAVLGSSTTSLGQLEQSVRAIYENAVALDRAAARQRIQALDEHLTSIQGDIGALRTRISASIDRERDSFTLGTVQYSPSTLGKWLAEQEAELGYIPDDIEPISPCPLSAAEIADLFRLVRDITPEDRAAARRRLPVAADLPTPAELALAMAELSDVRDQLAGTEAAIQDRVSLERLTPDELSMLINWVDQAAKRLELLEQPWLAAVRGELRTSSFAALWHDQIRAIGEGIEELAAWRNRLLGHRISLPDDDLELGETPLPGKELITQLTEIRDRLAAGKGINKTFHRDLYRVRQACQVDDEPPRTADDVDLCIIEARTRRRRQELTRRWNDAVGRIGGPPLSPGTSQPEYLLSEHVDGLKAALSWEDGEWRVLRDRLRSAGVRAAEVPTSAELAALADTLRVAALHVREKELASWFDAVAKRLADEAAQPQASPLWGALQQEFAIRAWDQWGRVVDEVRRVSGLTEEVARCDRLSARLAGVAPIWAGRIAASHGEETATGPTATALRAWEWRQAATWLTAIITADDPGELQRKLESALQAAAKTTAELAAQSAWLAVAERLTDKERRGLTAWLDALRRIGKGTGKYAPRWRSEAQKAMVDAQTAVPVWIMPAHRVVESFSPMARFDVVIMDESSQCDIFGLAALALADKAIIVGDDKQISPQAIGTDESAVHELIAQHIQDLPQSSLLDLKSSLYDLAKMRFPGVIMLREHFRCLPEIIEFSNRLSYNGAILPLREQPADPSWRSVIDVHIPDGFREPGTDTNIAEAEFIVSKIAELCADPAYDGKTFGVISLLGEGQAELIERKLIARLGEREMERRRVRCGNAYHFQGDERSVMFLSLVVAAGEERRIGAMTRESDRQRLNVAASRAQDQLWCVRSVSLEELHADDVRSQLIRYCQNPARVERATAEASFESDFERDVFRHVTGRGYRVRTQYRVGRYRIDLVVEGVGGRAGG